MGQDWNASFGSETTLPLIENIFSSLVIRENTKKLKSVFKFEKECFAQFCRGKGKVEEKC